MELNVYLRALVRYWFIPVTLLVVGVVAVWIYHNLRGEKEAEAKVAILQSIFPAPGEYLPPHLGFDAIDESDELAIRVAGRLGDGTTARDLEDKIEIDMTPKTDQRNPTPLYLVSAKDRDGDRARKIANLAVEEARTIFVEINQPSGSDVRAAFDEEINLARLQEVMARERFRAFQADNDAYSLPARISLLIDLTAQLRTGSLTGGGAADSAALSIANGDLERLRSLQPEYNQLRFEASLADSAIARLEQTLEGITTGGAQLAGVRSTAQSQLDAARQRSTEAHRELRTFLSANGVADLDGAIAAQAAQVNQLVVANASASANSAVMQRALATQDQELQRLMGLESEYAALSAEVVKAEMRLASIEQRMLDIIIAQSLPANAQVKVFGDAKIQSNLWFMMLTYALAVFLAVFLSLSTVYLLASFERPMTTDRELEEALGAPVIGRIPS